MRLDRFDATAKITYDRAVLDELFSLRFVADATNAIIMGPGRPWLTLRLSFTVLLQTVQADRVRPGYAGLCGARW